MKASDFSPLSRIFARARYQAFGDQEEVRLEFVETLYPNGRTAILARIEETQEPFAVLSVNVEDEILDLGEFYLKTWSENGELWQILVATGMIERVPDAEPVHLGFAVAHLYRVCA